MFPASWPGGDPFVYDKDFQEFGPGLRLTSDGYVVEVSNIPKSDITMVVNNPQLNDPFTEHNENLDADGLAQGLTEQTLHGRRNSDTIKVNSLYLQVRARLPRLFDDVAPRLHRVKIDYAIVGWKHDTVILDDGQNTVAYGSAVADCKPPIDKLIPVRPWGYERSLDILVTQQTEEDVVRTFARGSMYISTSGSSSQVKTSSIHKTFKNPLELSWDPAGQNGQLPNGYKLFCVFKSDVPTSTPPDYANVTPTIQALWKMKYFEP